jgi:murein L,D-transpeptidase YafK
MGTMARHGRLALAILGLGGLAVCVASAGAGRVRPDPAGEQALIRVQHPRVVVLKSKRRLHLFDGDRLVRTYAIGLGRSPTGDKQQEGDGRTPEGKFAVCVKKQDSPYHRFLGITYPEVRHARRGLAEGLITTGEAETIERAIAEGRCPSWSTALGGAIGIHGHGGGRDWTAGCIAMDDDQIEELFSVLRCGDPVEILP